MYYVLTALAAVMFGLQFFSNKAYQAAEGATPPKAVIFTFGTSLVTVLVMLIINKFTFEFTLFSFGVSVIYAAVCIFLTYFSINALSNVNMSMFSLFMMLGGMLLPFIFGIAVYNEKINLRKAAGLLIMCLTLFSKSNFKSGKKTFIYCILVFFLNGAAGIISKWHQSCENTVSSSSFMILKSLVSVIICIFLFAVYKIKHNRTALNRVSSVKSMSLYGLLNSLGNYFILISLKHIEASVQYPMITGGTIVVSSFISFVMHEKNSLSDIIAVVSVFISTVLIGI